MSGSSIFTCFFSGSNTSAFRNIGKLTAFNTIKAYEEAISVFGSLYFQPFQDISDNMPSVNVIQRFVVLMY